MAKTNKSRTFSKSQKKVRDKLKFGIPSRIFKNQTKKLFSAAGYNLEIDEEFYKVQIDDLEIDCILADKKEIASQIDEGILDAGITTKATILETNSKAVEICGLDFYRDGWGKTKVVLAVPKKSGLKSLKNLQGKRIITSVPEIAKKFLRENKISAKVIFSDGPNDSKVPSLADAVVTFVHFGDVLEFYNLKVLEVLTESEAILSANLKSLKNKWKREKIENLGLLLKGARLAQEMVGLMLHASNDMMEEVLKVLPALKKPTVTHLRGENWFDVFTVAEEKEVRKLIPKLKKIGCTDIIEFPLNKVII